MARKKLCDPQRALILVSNPQRQGFDSAQQEERRVGIHGPTKRGAGFTNFRYQVAASCGNSTNQVGMPAQELGTGMQHHVHAKFRGSLIDRSSKRAVNQSDELMFAGDFDWLAQIHYAQGRIRRRFKIKKFSVRTNSARMLIVVGGVHKCGLNPELRKPGGEKLSDATVNVALGNNVVTTFHER